MLTKNAAELYWPGTSVTVLFEGTAISAILKDSDTANYYNVIIDDKVVDTIHTDTTKHSYLLASGLPFGKHKVQLFKRTESDKGKTCFYSRSRQKLWRKGESSGHIQKVKEVYIDCDGDAVLIKVDQIGGACHTGYRSCFFRKVADNKFIEVGTKVFDEKEVYRK